MKLRKNVSGFTVVEVLVSAVILSIGFGIYLRFLALGDKTQSRMKRLEYAALIVQNEAERIKAQYGMENYGLSDSLYDISINSINFIVLRKQVEPDFTVEEKKSWPGLCEVEILIRLQENDSTVLTARLLQPCVREDYW